MHSPSVAHQLTLFESLELWGPEDAALILVKVVPAP